MTVRESLYQRGIPRAAVADLANVHPPEVSLFLRNPAKVSEARRTKIERAVADLIFLVDQLAGSLPNQFALRPNWKDPDSVRNLILYCRDARYRALVDAGAVAGMN